ncbi:MAG: phosphatase PAP2 family protein [Candidatus Paceibacterota bacterium]|jgi:undecaprenyl-diphosphatase
MNLKRNFSILLVLIICFLLITLGIASNNHLIAIFDQAIASFVEGMRTPFLNDLMIFVTKIGDTYEIFAIFVILSIFLLAKRKKYRFYVFAIATSLGIVLPETIKFLMERIRPIGSLIMETNYSFPSGHATISTIYLLSLVLLMIPLLKNSAFRILSLTATIIIFPLIALSRIYLSVHFASDVLAGIFLGLICYLLSFTLVFHKHIAVK